MQGRTYERFTQGDAPENAIFVLVISRNGIVIAELGRFRFDVNKGENAWYIEIFSDVSSALLAADAEAASTSIERVVVCIEDDQLWDPVWGGWRWSPSS
ncbi:hypothetical protein [Devosia enhydra]|uniref:hypothetical protein n=1 Tax=Devosia enhydra TaxID=665118 RepID=UPI0011607A63|nr:hypothetical protein [Devosia enhydra]